MKYDGMTEVFVNFIDVYKIKKTKELVKEIVEKLEKNIQVNQDESLFNKQKMIYKNDFFEEVVKWEKFKTEKEFTTEKLKDRIIKKIKEVLGDGDPQIDIIRKLKYLKESLGIETFQSSMITFSIVRKWLKSSKKNAFEYEYSHWIDNVSQNAHNVSFSTHVAKLTHSTISGNTTNIYFDTIEKEPYYLSTASIGNKILDISQTNALYSPIGKFLELSHNSITMADKLKRGDISDLEYFAKDEKQLNRWREDFLNSFKTKSPSSHFLAKQIYFPINDDYHLLTPLVSSSLEQAVFEKIQYSKYKETKEIRDAKGAKKFHKEINISYPNLALLMVTASNHSNASPLNGKRSGKRYLFPSNAPKWKSSLKPPLKQSSLFWGEYDRRVWKETKELQEYLLKMTDKTPNMYIRNNVKRNINWIIDTLFDYVAEIQEMKALRGWSKEATELKKSHALWLDPYREDEAFQVERREGEWRDEVSLDFGKWLNKKLDHKKMLFAKINAERWAKLLSERLREFESNLEVRK